MSIIIKELSKWVIFRKGWKFVLIAFIAVLDASTWFYTEDSRKHLI